MPPSSRRRYLAALATATTATTALAGCSGLTGSTEPPAGSLRFDNRHTVPHAVGLEVVDVGAEPGPEPGTVQGDPDAVVPESLRTLTATDAVDPGETVVHEGVFTAPVWYAVRFTLDGSRPDDGAGQVAFGPAPAEEERGSLLGAEVRRGGEFTWAVISTDDAGPLG
jgi:hypothetical protein